MATWNDIITMAGSDRFVGREQEMLLFRQHIKQTPPRFLIYTITGRDGVGKTALLNRCRQIASQDGFVLADCDGYRLGLPFDVGSRQSHMMGHFASQLQDQGFPLKQFERRYRSYCQFLTTLAHDSQAPHGLAAMLEQVLIREVYQTLDTLPEVRGLLTSLKVSANGREMAANWQDEWSRYLQQKLGNSDDVALVRDPVASLTPLFIQDLNRVASRKPVLLCFDHIETLCQEITAWLAHLPNYQPSEHIRVAIASSQPLGTALGALQPVTLTMKLAGLNQDEAERILDMYGICSAERRRDIIETSEGLPLLLNWQAATGEQQTGRWASRDMVERFLQQIENPELRRVVLLAALPQSFNADMISTLLQEGSQEADIQAAMVWLQALPFVEPHPDGFCYHPLARRMLQRYQSQSRSSTYYQDHSTIAAFYDQRRQQFATLSQSERWANEVWCRDTLDYIFHALIASPRTYWSSALGLLAQAMWERLSFATEIANLLNRDDIRDELPRTQMMTVRIMSQHLDTIKRAGSQPGANQQPGKPLHMSVTEIFEELRDIVEMPPQIRSYVFNSRGVFSLANQGTERALTDFNRALEVDPHNTAALLLRGITWLSMQRYGEALTDLDKVGFTEESTLFFTPAALRLFAMLLQGAVFLKQQQYEAARTSLDAAATIDKHNAWVFAQRGEACRQMDDYQAALADFSRAVTLDSTDAWSFARRGDIHRQMGNYDMALSDLERAVSLDPSDAWAFASRGETHRRLEQHEMALKDFDRAIALDPTDAWTFASRADTHRRLGNHPAALADFNRAIEIDPTDPWPIASRGEVYRAMGELESAVANFNWAIELDDQDIWTMVSRGEVHYSLGRYELALFDFDRVIALDPTCTPAMLRRSETYYAMGRYDAALAELDQIVAAYDQSGTAPRAAILSRRGEVCMFLGNHEAAATDFSRAIALDTTDAQSVAQRGLARLSLKEHEAALTDFTRASNLDAALGKGEVTIAPTTTTGPALRGETYRLLGQYEQAVADFNQALTAYTQDTWAFARRGAAYRALGCYNEALTDFNQAVTLNKNKDDTWALAGRGETYRLLGQYEQAVTDFNRAVTLDDSDAWVVAHRGETYRLLGQYDKAVADFNRAIAMDETYAWAIAHRAETYRQMEQYQNALSDFTQALKLNAGDAWTIAQRGETYRSSGQQRAALNDFDTAIKAAPQEAWYLYLRARHHLLAGHTNPFQRDLNRAIELARNSAATEVTSFNLGLYYLAANRPQEAETSYNSGIATCTLPPLLQAALDDLQDLMTMQPANTTAARIRDQVEQRLREVQAQTKAGKQ